MNYLQFAMFGIFVFSAASAGTGIYTFLDKDNKSFINKYIYAGESLLLGSILLVGELLILSLMGLYQAGYLWSVTLLNSLFLVNRTVRYNIFNCLISRNKIGLPHIIFYFILGIFIFRNCYFLVDVDSHTSYLFTQRLWLTFGTSLYGSISDNNMIFFPQFDAVPYSLGLSIFPQETLYPQLINLFWRLIVLLLVFGYTSHRFNTFYGLSAVLFVVLNDHFFFSGVNRPVLLNGAVIAFLFAGVYNFWESSIKNDTLRFSIGFIFIFHLLSNKYQMAYVWLFLLFLAIFTQAHPIERIKGIMKDIRYRYFIIIASMFVALWYFKNMLVTGDPFFPMFAGRLGIFNWVPEQDIAFIRFFGGIPLLKFIKYMNYLFIWPGINPAKIVIVAVSLLPLIIWLSFVRGNFKINRVTELCFWMTASILSIMGICLASHWDPRYYRYTIALLSFLAVFSIDYILRFCFNIKNEIILAAVIFLFAGWGYQIVYEQGGSYKRPYLKENIGTVLNKIHMEYIINKHYPEVNLILDGIEANKDKFDRSAWGMDTEVNFPFFLLPLRPAVSLWRTSIIGWNSYNNETLILNDLKRNGIDWVMKLKGRTLAFIPVEEYAKTAVRYNRHTETFFGNYNFPLELNQAK